MQTAAIVVISPTSGMSHTYHTCHTARMARSSKGRTAATAMTPSGVPFRGGLSPRIGLPLVDRRGWGTDADEVVRDTSVPLLDHVLQEAVVDRPVGELAAAADAHCLIHRLL